MRKNESIQLVITPSTYSLLQTLVLIAILIGDALMWVISAAEGPEWADDMKLCCIVNTLSVVLCGALILLKKLYSITAAMHVIIWSIMFSLYMYIYNNNRIICHVGVLIVIFLMLIRLRYSFYPTIYSF